MGLMTTDIAKDYLLALIKELEWSADYKLYSSFIGTLLVLQAVGRACMLNPSSLLYCFLPEKYNDPDIKIAIENFDSRPMYLCLNKDTDSHRIEFGFEKDKHLSIKLSMEVFTDGTFQDLTIVYINGQEFVQDTREVIIRVFEYSKQDKEFFKKLKVAFSEYKFIGLD